MTLGGDVLTPEQLSSLEHVGVKGMKWGVRKTPAERAASQKVKAKNKAVKRSDKEKLKLESKLSAGEVVASALIAGPVGLIGYKMIKRNAAQSKLKNKNLSGQKQTEAAAKVGIGKGIAVGLLTGPVGLITYAGAKTAAAYQVDDF